MAFATPLKLIQMNLKIGAKSSKIKPQAKNEASLLHKRKVPGRVSGPTLHCKILWSSDSLRKNAKSVRETVNNKNLVTY